MQEMEPVRLRGALVLIEPLRIEHAAGLLAAADADEVFAWLPYPRPGNLEEARSWIEGALADQRAARRLPFAVRSEQDGTIIGSTSYWHFDSANAQVEIGSTWFNQSSWGTGRNAEAKLMLLSHAFGALTLERVAFRTDIRNERSRRAIEKLGAVREGVHRHEMRRRDGSWRDSVHYSLIREEWPAARAELLRRLDRTGQDPLPPAGGSAAAAATDRGGASG